MTEKTLVAGFGGQGVVSLGRLWVECAMAEGLEVSFFPSYGAEKRGGISRASLIVSSEEIASPLVTTANSAVVMDENSLPVCEEVLAPGGFLILNSSLVRSEPARKDIKVRRIPATKIAEELGNGKAANSVMLGALAELTGAVKLSAIDKVLEENFGESKKKLIDLNAAAVREGIKAARAS